jgi:cytochrome c oxidase subunit 1/cytochrome c oxidase subunit I+III
MFAAVPFDQQITDSYFVVAHFHYVLFGGAVFPIFAAIHYWVPKMYGRMMDEGLGRLAFWLMFIGFNLTFFPMHVSGLLGMPRRIYTYHAGLGWDLWNMLSTIGSFVLALGILVVVVNFLKSVRTGAVAGPDPWGGETLEWATASPPPPYNFLEIPTVRSVEPLWDQPELRGIDQQVHEPRRVLLGHETLGTSVMDADAEAVLPMPHGSYVPVATALGLAGIFAGLLTGVIAVTVLGVGTAVLGVLFWFRVREEAAEPHVVVGVSA